MPSFRRPAKVRSLAFGGKFSAAFTASLSLFFRTKCLDSLDWNWPQYTQGRVGFFFRDISWLQWCRPTWWLWCRPISRLQWCRPSFTACNSSIHKKIVIPMHHNTPAHKKVTATTALLLLLNFFFHFHGALDPVKHKGSSQGDAALKRDEQGRDMRLR